MEYHICILAITTFLLFAFRNNEKIIVNCYWLCALVVIIFCAIRYNYGLDYWNYYSHVGENMSGNDRSLTGEFLFYLLFNSFSYYMGFIVFQSIFVFGIFFYFSYRNVNKKYYWLLFMTLLATPGLFFNLISAIRCSFAAAIIWLAIEFFLKGNSKRFYYYACVIIATLFHTSAAIFVFVPLLNKYLIRFNVNRTVLLLIISLILGFGFSSAVLDIVLSSSSLTKKYLTFYEAESYNLNGIIFKALYIFPAYYIFKNKRLFMHMKSIYTCTFLFLFLHFCALDWQGRYTEYMLLFYIVSIIKILPDLKRKEYLITMIPFFFHLIYGLYVYYIGLFSLDASLDGNMLFYQTIFDAPKFI